MAKFVSEANGLALTQRGYRIAKPGDAITLHEPVPAQTLSP